MNEETYEEECRACLKNLQKGVSHQLFEAWFTPWAVRGALIADDLAKFADVEISQSDEYSKVICSECYKRLTDACTFMITVQMNDGLLRSRRPKLKSTDEKNNDHDTPWPQPILLNKGACIDNQIQVEVKQEVLSEDENVVHDMAQDWEPTMDIKIEPEEITGTFPPYVVNGTMDETNGGLNIKGSNSNYSLEEYLDNTIKQEPMSGDEELSEEALDMPLECLLCSREFHSVSGLKAHVIAEHSYGTVKRKLPGCQSPSENRIETSDFTCDTCDQSFKTHTDLMLHTASHSEHVCYVCDAKFKTFQQLSRHGPRCRKKQTNAAKDNHIRPPIRPQQLSKHTKERALSIPQEISQPVNNTARETVTTTTLIRKLKPQNLPWKIQEVKAKCESPSIEYMVVEKVQESVKTWSSSEAMDIKETETRPKIRKIEVGNDQEIIKIKLIDKPSKDKPSTSKVKTKENINEQLKADSKAIDSQIQDELVQESQRILKEESLESNKIAEENTTKKVKEQCHNESLSKEMADESTEEIQTPFKESNDEHLVKDVQNSARSVDDDINTYILNSEAITSENSSDQDELTISQEPSPETDEKSIFLPEVSTKEDEEESCEILTNANENLEHLHTSSQNELSVELSLEMEENNCSLPDSTSPLQQSNENSEIMTSTLSENLELVKSNSFNSDQIIKESSLEQTTEHKDTENINNHQNREQKKLSVKEISAANSPNEDEISEMKVHLAINPLNKDPVPFVTEIEDIACHKSESCEPKLVVLSESSNTENS